MARIYWQPAGSLSAYGSCSAPDITLDEAERIDAAMVEYIEQQGHIVEIGSRTDSDQDRRTSDELDDEELDDMFIAAWEFALNSAS